MGKKIVADSAVPLRLAWQAAKNRLTKTLEFVGNNFLLCFGKVRSFGNVASNQSSTFFFLYYEHFCNGIGWPRHCGEGG
jgi:hypothetical protein